MKILAISGSLRAQSSNTNLLLAAALCVPEKVEVTLYKGLSSLPQFNPDIEEHSLPAEAAELRALVGASDGLLISSPEYAHGVPGVLKNSLDWLVGGFEFIDKPIALLNASPQSKFAHPQLMETMRVMSGRIVEDACITLPMSAMKLSPEEIAGHAVIGPMLKDAMKVFCEGIGESRIR